MTNPNFSRADRDYILQQLRTHVIDVDFIKADGTARTLKCTLVTELLPPVETPVIDLTKPAKHKAENLDVIAAWDIESKGWRSFRLDSVRSITIHKWHTNEVIKERV